MVEPGPAFGRFVTSLGSRRMTDSFTSFDGEDLGFSNAAAAVFIDRDE